MGIQSYHQILLQSLLMIEHLPGVHLSLIANRFPANRPIENVHLGWANCIQHGLQNSASERVKCMTVRTANG